MGTIMDSRALLESILKKIVVTFHNKSIIKQTALKSYDQLQAWWQFIPQNY